MTAQEKLDKIKELVEAKSKVEAAFDDEDGLCDYLNGNQDDAYSLGRDDGEIGMARNIMEIISESV